MATTTNTQQTFYRNTSGARKYFGYLGPHGMYLNANQDVAIDGTIWSLHGRNPMHMSAFQADLAGGIITILKTPEVYCYDTTGLKTLVLGINNAAAVAKAADWGSYAGPVPAPPVNNQ